MNRIVSSALACAGATLLSGAALAHPGHDAGLAAGLAHPFGGIDHLAAMVMVGLWAGLDCRRRRWAVPALFVGFMLAGFGWGMAGGGLPLAEPLVAASVAALALLIFARLAFAVRPPLALAAPLVAVLATGHGLAHGAEMPTTADPAGFALGLALATIALHLAGLGLAAIARRRRIGLPASWSR